MRYTTYHENKKDQEYEYEEIYWSQRIMSSSHRRKIKISKNHTKLRVDARNKCAVFPHMCAKDKKSKLGERKELNKKHDGECSQVG